ELIQVKGQRALAIIKRLANASGYIQQKGAKSVQRAYGSRPSRIQQFPGHAEVGAARKFLVVGQPEAFEPGSRDQTRDRFGDDAAKCLVEPCNLRRLQAHAGIVENAAERTRINAAEGRTVKWHPAKSRFGGNLILVSLIPGYRRESDSQGSG